MIHMYGGLTNPQPQYFFGTIFGPMCGYLTRVSLVACVSIIRDDALIPACTFSYDILPRWPGRQLRARDNARG